MLVLSSEHLDRICRFHRGVFCGFESALVVCVVLSIHFYLRAIRRGLHMIPILRCIERVMTNKDGLIDQRVSARI